jgi:LmbE family N-acetylglucosaminyl deacetylase
MRILYVFPHPDDESFGPARAISAQVRGGHEVCLLTLTKGGATKERLKFGYTVAQMGDVRRAEMQEVARVLGLADLTVLDFPDGGLKELDPRTLEAVVADHVEAVRPDVLVTYPVHGISGFHDHLVIHAVVKRAFVDSRERDPAPPKRLAFFTLTEEQAKVGSGVHRLSGSTEREIDCLFAVDDEDMATFRRALDGYVTYRETIEKTGVRASLDRTVAFEFFGESFDPPVDDLCADIGGSPG